MGFGASFKYVPRRCGQHSVCHLFPRRERSHQPRIERRSSFSADHRRPQSPTSSVPRIDPRRTTKLDALQSSPLLSTNNATTIHLGVEYIQLLGLHLGESLTESKVLSAFSRLSSEKIEEGYSARAVAGRQHLLEDAKEAALKLVGKKLAPENNKGIDLPIHLVPGALSLLAAVEEFDLVIQMGKKMLDRQDASNMKRDILLSMALAKLGQAEYYFSVPNQVAMACTRMEEALQLLTDGDSPQLAPVLCKEIEDALETYVPQCVSDQLKLPLTTDNAKGRKDAVSILKGLLAVPKTVDAPFIGLDRHYVKQVMDCLTTTEILQIIDWGTVLSDPKCVKWYYPGLLLKGAATHIVVGFLQRRPALIRHMDSILSLPGKDRVAHVEHMICKILLGDVNGAFEILDKIEGAGKLESARSEMMDGGYDIQSFGTQLSSMAEHNAVGAKVLPGRNETLAFVKAHSDGESDGYLTGMCLFVERWLQHAGFIQFRDIEARRPSTALVDYFKDRKVQNALNYTPGSHNGLFGMIHPNRREEEANRSQPLFKSNGSRPNVHDAGPSLMMPWNAKQNGTYYSQGYVAPSTTQTKRPVSIWLAMFGGAILGSALFTAIRHPWMRVFAHPIDAQITKPKPAEIKYIQSDQKMVLPMPVKEKRLKRPVLPLRKAEAEKLIQKWQFAKARALGPEHDFKYMTRILANPMLDKWTANIKEVAEKGLFWKYKLDHCKITHVDASRLNKPDGFVDVTATLKESAIMFGEDGKEVDRYRSRYDVAYHVVLDSEGRWRISNVQVMTPQS